MLKAFKYEFPPKKDQKILLAKTFGCVRFVYNWDLNKKSKAWEEKQENISTFDLTKEVSWLK
ncbi:MAG: helix-turn-helix domain-containing protein [Chitinophagales bacterium]